MPESVGTWLRKGVSLFFEYDTPRIVHIKSKRVSTKIDSKLTTFGHDHPCSEGRRDIPDRSSTHRQLYHWLRHHLRTRISRVLHCRVSRHVQVEGYRLYQLYRQAASRCTSGLAPLVQSNLGCHRLCRPSDSDQCFLCHDQRHHHAQSGQEGSQGGPKAIYLKTSFSRPLALALKICISMGPRSAIQRVQRRHVLSGRPCQWVMASTRDDVFQQPFNHPVTMGPKATDSVIRARSTPGAQWKRTSCPWARARPCWQLLRTLLCSSRTRLSFLCMPNEGPTSWPRPTRPT